MAIGGSGDAASFDGAASRVCRPRAAASVGPRRLGM
jgi:hypothetical protein